jgi:hypothetical protein
MKILFKLPSRGREARFFASMESILNNLADKENFHISCTLDEDDEIMNRPEVIERIETFSNTSIEWGLSTSKIHAINRSMPDVNWEILVNPSDDIFFNIYGFDEMIRNEMRQNFPDGDGYLHFNEQDSGTALNVMTIIDRTYYSRFNFIYHPDYFSLWVDNEQFEVAKALGRYVYVPYSIMEHRNPAYEKYGMERDAKFDEDQKIGWTVDQETYHRRKAINFEIEKWRK